MNFGNLSNYLSRNCYQPITRGICEGLRNTDIEKGLNNIKSFLKKRGIYLIPALKPMKIENTTVFTIMGFNNNNCGVAFNWEQGSSTSIRSILFTKDFDMQYLHYHNHIPMEWDVEIQLKGASIVRSLQLVADVMNGKVAMTTAALNKAVRDAQIWECVSEEEINMLFEASDDAVIAELERKRNNLYQKLKDWEKKGKDTADLQTQYDDIKNQLNDARISVRGRIVTQAIPDPAVEKMQARFEEEERATPEERFGDMQSYITKVILGLRPSALICGAPGVGKTYRIMKNIKTAGKTRGVDFGVIKGKCTPLVLFKMLHDYQKKGQLVVIDDADDILTDDTSINLLKAATDSGEERIVSYGSNAKIFANEGDEGIYDDLEQDPKTGKWVYPREFVTEGGVIIITNRNAGQIDTAVRNRALICDLSFTVNEVLGLVRNLAPHISPETLTPEAKEKALAYLENLAEKGDPMEVSIRSFIIVAEEYLSDAPQAAIERRIREQMKWQAARGGKRY